MGDEARLSVVCTPIGNLSDLSDRARETLAGASFWIVEDTRVSGKLGSVLEVKKPMRILNEHTGDNAVAAYADQIEEGEWAALLTDGGAPGISDPGAKLVDVCLERGIRVEPIPGPSAPIAAISASGFFAQRFAFLGFLPRKAGDIRSELAPFADSPYTLVLFESPFRIDALLKAAHEALGDRRYVICREITKAFEQIWRSSLPYIPTEKEVPRKGEFTIVIEGKRKRVP